MKKSETRNVHDEKLIMQTEQEIQKNVDELMVWLGGTVRYFVHSIKGLSEISKDKDKFRSYVTARLFKNIDRLSEIADIYAPDNAPKEGKEYDKEIQKALKESLRGYSIKPDDAEDLFRYFTSVTTSILAVNIEEFQTMRMHISALKFMSHSADDFGSDLLDYICDHILRSQYLPHGKRMAATVCLVTAAMEVEDKLLGDFAESIADIIDQATMVIFMSIVNDYLASNKKEEKVKE